MDLALDEQLNSRNLAADKRSAQNETADKSSAEQVAEIVDKVKDFKKVLRMINLAFAASVVGLVVTYLIMSVQIFVGNLLGVKMIALEGIEIGMYAALSFILFMLLLMILSLVAFVSDPWNTAIGTLDLISQWLFSK